jgi:hypothetical protein
MGMQDDTGGSQVLKHLRPAVLSSRRPRSGFSVTRGVGSQTPQAARWDFKTRAKRAGLSWPGCVLRGGESGG